VEPTGSSSNSLIEVCPSSSPAWSLSIDRHYAYSACGESQDTQPAWRDDQITTRGPRTPPRSTLRRNTPGPPDPPSVRDIWTDLCRPGLDALGERLHFGGVALDDVAQGAVY
jgi:hypothetical protein